MILHLKGALTADRAQEIAAKINAFHVVSDGKNVLISGSDAALSAVRSRRGRVFGHVVTCPIHRDLHEAADALAGLSCQYTLSGRIFPFGSLVLPLLRTWLKTCFPRRTASVFFGTPRAFLGPPLSETRFPSSVGR